MKIIFWGTPKYAADNLIEIFKAGHEIIAAVTQPDRKRGRGKKLTPSPVKNVSIDLGIPVLTTPSISKDHKTKEILRNLNADIFLVVAFGQILPSDILDYPKFGCWNSHASLLPAWRGAAPIQWSILNGDSKTGVCIMSMEEGLDTGPVIEQEAININDSVTTIPVVSSNPFTASGTVQIGDEKITYTGVDGTNLTGCTRGTASTSAASHSIMANVIQI